MIQTDQRNRIHVYIELMRIYKVRPLELNAYGLKFFRPLHSASSCSKSCVRNLKLEVLVCFLNMNIEVPPW